VNKDEVLKLVREAYKIGFAASGEGYNGEFPFGDKQQNMEEDKNWVEGREMDLEEMFMVIGENE
jgi:hypothetical protein